jgi:hypothetical protein
MRRRLSWYPVLVAVCAGLLLTLAGCGGASHHTPPAAAQPPTLGPTLAVADPGTAVVGGAPISLPPGSPPLCTSLATSVAIRGIPTALTQLADPRSRATGAAGLREAAGDLRALAAGADVAVGEALRAAADALDRLAQAGTADSAAVVAAHESLVRLGERVQDRCHFAVG